MEAGSGGVGRAMDEAVEMQYGVCAANAAVPAPTSGFECMPGSRASTLPPHNPPFQGRVSPLGVILHHLMP